MAAGRAHNQQWADRARQEQRENARFRWAGELGQQATQDLLLASRVMVISSVMEGGANVVSEACRAGIPIIASDIPGNRGLLGADYPGYFPAGDESALAELLAGGTTTEFLASLQAQVAARAAVSPRKRAGVAVTGHRLALKNVTHSG